MKKFNRNYIAKFEIGSRDENGNTKKEYDVDVSYPVTCNFTIELGVYTAVNSAAFEFINLSKELQVALWKDDWNATKYVKIQFYAGYGNDLKFVYEGLIQNCYTVKESGSTEYRTVLTAAEGSYLSNNVFVNYTFLKGTKFVDVLRGLLEQVKEEENKIGYISPSIGDLKRDRTYIGRPLDLLRKDYSGYDIFVEKGRLNIIADNEVIKNYVPKITSQNGLLGSPQRTGLSVDISMLFEPNLMCGQLVDLECDSLPFLNQYYKVVQVSHKGTISPTQSAPLITNVVMFIMGKNFEFIDLQEDEKVNTKEISTSGWVKPTNAKVTGAYGEPRRTHKHQGIDFGCNLNTEVKACYSGKIYSYKIVGGYGNLLTISHGQIDGKEITSRYAHLNSIKVKVGQTVKAGDIIALSGGAKGTYGAGNSEAPHLHFEILENGQQVSPEKYIGKVQ